MNDRTDPTRITRLSPADAALVDELLAARAEGEDVAGRIATTGETGGGATEDRPARVMRLLDLLEHWPAGHPSDDLVAATVQRAAGGAESYENDETSVAGPRRLAESPAGLGTAGAIGRPIAALVATLNEQDAAALDELIEARAAGDGQVNVAANASSASHHTSVDASPTAARVAGWLNVIDHMPAAAPSDDLVARTMARIDKAERRRAVLAHVDEHSGAYTGGGGDGGGGIAFRWYEMIGVAAVLLIAVSILFPIIERTRTDSVRVACANNLATIGYGLGGYAQDNAGQLPRYANLGDTWWNVREPMTDDGRVQSNSANLYLLRRHGYVTADAMNCPSNADAPDKLPPSAFDWPSAEAISYSYQNQFTERPTLMNRRNGIVVLADKNPLFTPAAGGAGMTFNAGVDVDAPGERHERPGQSILIIDGHVLWTEQPIINGDNFYAADGYDAYTGTEIPDWDDAFVVP